MDGWNERTKEKRKEEMKGIKGSDGIYCERNNPTFMIYKAKKSKTC